MSYVTQAEMEARFSVADLIALTDRTEPPGGVINVTVLGEAIDQASGLLDGYISGQYEVPVASPTSDLKLHCTHIAYYLLHRDSAPDKVAKDYEIALRWARDVADGRIQLTGASTPTEAAASAGAEIDAPDRVFTNDTMAGF